MAITTALCNTFKQELLGGTHDLTNDTIKIALITAGASGSYGPGTQSYNDIVANSDEVVGTGYVAGGQTLDSATVTLSGSTAFVDFADEVIITATISADGCIIYNESKENRGIAVIDFGGTKTSTNGDFTIQFPAADANNAIIRIA